jgi:molybdopterin/thiamine biosynthesis adenylyltransferase
VAEVSQTFYEDAFQRNLGLVSEEEQQVLKRACVAVAGAGGVGGLHLLALARMGVGRFHLADFDTFEVSNFNRQFGATTETIGKPKIDVMRDMVLSINPGADVRLFPEGVQPDNVDSFLDGASIVVDGIDYFAFDARRLLFNRARAAGLYVLTSGPIGFGSTLQVFSPTGMSFDEYFGNYDQMTEFEKFIAFTAGIAPAVLHRRYLDLSKVKLKAGRGPVVASSCLLCSALIASEVVTILLKRRAIKAVPYYFQFDTMRQVYKKGYIPGGARNPLQTFKRWQLRRFMKRLLASQAASG